MKTKLSILAALVAALSLQAQEARTQVQTGNLQGEAQVEGLPENRGVDIDADADLNADIDNQNLEQQSTVTSFNKASGLMGMDVRNAQGEELGEIQDIVFDLQSGRIGYVVLSVGGFLGVGEKYIALPPGALSPSVGDEKLVLNAEKSKIESAPGFVKTQWPDPSNPEWSAYWGAETEANKQGKQTFENDTTFRQDQQLQRQDQQLQGQDQRLQQREQRSERRDLDVQRNQGNQAGTQFGTQNAQQMTVKGTITKVDAEGKSITIKSDTGTQTFVLDSQATVRLQDNPSAKLNDLKQGDMVSVKFSKQGASNRALMIQEVDKAHGGERK